jgi:methionyl-tRNA formyltransferase
MRLIFAGSPEFARRSLEALLAAGHDVTLVLTQPERPAGRGLKRSPNPVKQAALTAGIPVVQPRSLRLDGKYADEATATRAKLEETRADAMVVVAYGLILPQWVLTLPRFGCLNIHASLLPRWRGAAPIQRAIEAGDECTGVTIMQMDEGLDTGDMLLVRSVPIDPEQTAGQLHDILAATGAQAIVEALQQLAAGTLTAQPQAAEGVTYAAKLDKAEAVLDCTQPAVVLARRVRAFNPVPGATLPLPGLADPVKVWRAQAIKGNRIAAVKPGSVISHGPEGIDVATSEGVLRLLEVQKAGGKRQSVDLFVRGWQQQAGSREDRH